MVSVSPCSEAKVALLRGLSITFEGRKKAVKKGKNKGQARACPVDPNMPRWVCQNCHNPLCIIGVDSYADKFFNDPSCSGIQGSFIHGASSVLSMTKWTIHMLCCLSKDLTLREMLLSYVAGGAFIRAFEIAMTQTQVEQPLSLDCMRILSVKLDKEVEDVNKDIEAYEVCLKCLEGETRDVLGEADFLKETLKGALQSIEEEERRLEAAIEETKRQNAEVNAELRELELKSSRFKALEEPERDEILAMIEVSQAHLELLKRTNVLNETNVLNDAFPISHDGEFGTINNFRLGRLPKIPVQWDEINAAWGQACLLHTMCQYRIKIIPMGSYPRVTDTNNSTYELIENDKVENFSITQSFNKQESWTKSLKYTLCNLKWALYWFVGNTNFLPLSAMISSYAEGSMYTKRSLDAKSKSRN
ncbi:hypothetical protein VNO78_11639 [Psophocarpus tetragonolobus]|uniref:Beclin-1-like protein n=1 Tax=Psophocarpus tetragonolobus TaxID=3891 RepID=A0AAN9XP68_PSOTE